MPESIEQLLREIRDGQREIREGQAAHRESVGRALQTFSDQCHEMNVEQARQGERLDSAVDDIAQLKADLRELAARPSTSPAQHGLNAASGGLGGALIMVANYLWMKATGGHS